jgi:hypothetical protein
MGKRKIYLKKAKLYDCCNGCFFYENMEKYECSEHASGCNWDHIYVVSKIEEVE